MPRAPAGLYSRLTRPPYRYLLASEIVPVYFHSRVVHFLLTVTLRLCTGGLTWRADGTDNCVRSVTECDGTGSMSRSDRSELEMRDM